MPLNLLIYLNCCWVMVEEITRAVECALGGLENDGELFLVEVRELAGDVIEVLIDSDGRTAEGKARGVSVGDCVMLTRAIHGCFDEGALDDYSLTVSSAGVGQALKVPRQYRKLIGKAVEVVMKSGRKFVKILDATDEDAIVVEGETVALGDIKSVREHIDFK